jgi:hypothetical protein
MRATSLFLIGILFATCAAAAQYAGIESMPSVPPTVVKRIDCEVVSVNVEKMEITLRDKKDGKEYVTLVDKSAKLRADKKVLKGKPVLADFKAGDQVKVVLLPQEQRLAEIKLVKRGSAPSGS